jgi:hypothetical protein
VAGAEPNRLRLRSTIDGQYRGVISNQSNRRAKLQLVREKEPLINADYRFADWADQRAEGSVDQRFLFGPKFRWSGYLLFSGDAIEKGHFPFISLQE